MHLNRVSENSNTTGAMCGAETSFHSLASEFAHGYSEVCVPRSLVFSVMVCKSCYVLPSPYYTKCLFLICVI